MKKPYSLCRVTLKLIAFSNEGWYKCYLNNEYVNCIDFDKVTKGDRIRCGIMSYTVFKVKKKKVVLI